MNKHAEPDEIIQSNVEAAIKEEHTLQVELSSLESELSEVNPKFQLFIQKQAELRFVQSKNAEIWKTVEMEMIANDIKSIKGDFGSITLAERLSFDTTDELPSKFYKKVVDTKKLADTFRLENRPIKGATPKYSKYLVKRLK